MSRTRKLTVQITGDAKGLASTLSTTENKVGGLGSKFSGLSGKAKVALAGAGAAVVSFAKSSVDAFVAAEQAQGRLDDAFEKFPQLAGGNIQALRALNSELARKTKFDDDATASAQATLAQFGLTQKQLEQITPLVQDYAAKTGKDLTTAATDVGKAMLGQGRAFKSVGLNLKDTGSKAGNLEQLMWGLSRQVGGFAEKEGKTAAGRAAILKNQFGELQEEIGAKLLPVLLGLADVGLKIIDFFSKLSPEMKVAVGVVAALGAGLFTVVKAVQAWKAAQVALNIVLSANPIGLVVAAIAAFVAGLVLAYQKVDWFRAFVDESFAIVKGVITGVFNWVKNNWPLVLGILTGPIGLAVAAIVKHWDKIKSGAAAVFNWVKNNWPLLLAIITGPIGLAVLVIATHWDKIKSGATAVKGWVVARFNEMVGFFAGLPGRISAFASDIWNALKRGLGEAVDWILGQLDRLLGPLDEIAGKVGGVLDKIGGIAGGIGGAIGSFPGFASGVHNFRGGLAVVGERGPELLNLPRGSDVIPLTGRGGGSAGAAPVTNLYVSGSVLSDRDLVAVINRTQAKGIR